MSQATPAPKFNEVRKHLNALTHEARLMRKAAEDPAFTMSALDVTAVADLITDRAAAILAVLEADQGGAR